ncbi:MAG: hypothetical protein ACKOE2_10195, partial [Actinomycetales bacterium]
MGRRPWGAIIIVVTASIALVTVLSAGISLAGVGVSIALGWAIGLITRYALGTPTTRPTGQDVAQALARGGFAVQRLVSEVTTRRGRRYRAETVDGQVLRVTVLDRDLEGADIVRTLWQSLRLRDERGLDPLNMRRGLDHAALTGYAAMAAGAPVAELHLVAEVGPDAALMAFAFLDAVPLHACDDLSEQDAIAAWQAVKCLHEHQISHRALTADNILRGADGRIWLVGRLMVYDALEMTYRQVRVRKDPNCAVCGPNATVTELIDYEAFCGTISDAAAEAARDSTISVLDLRRMLDARERGEDDFLLV